MSNRHRVAHYSFLNQPSRPRRGVAMLLVLISLATATILTMAYVSSRDNSIEIGANVADSATARWSAMSGLELGIAVLETESDWRTNHTNGLILDNYALGDALVDLLAEDIETGALPTESTSDVRLTSIASVGGVTQTASATAHVDDSAASGIDLDLSEFSVFTSGPVLLKNNSTITRWPTAPASAMGKRISMGTQSLSSGSVMIENNAAAIDTTVYLGAGASGTAVMNTASPGLDTEGLLANIPLPAPPQPNVQSVEETQNENLNFTDLSVSNPTSIEFDSRYDNIEVSSKMGILQLDGDITLVAEQNIHLRNDSGVVVNGNVTIVVFDDLVLDNKSFIELMPGASLTLFVTGDVSLDDAYIGNLRADRSVLDTSGNESYMNPERITIFDMENDSTWTTKDATVVKANIYTPRMNMVLADDTAIYGRVAVAKLEMKNRAAIFYDHALNSGGGYTNPNSMVFEADGTLKSDVTSLASLDPADLQALADALAAPVTNLLGELLNPLLGGGGGEVVLGPTDPTPRTITVVMDFEQHGADSSTWESQADGAIVVKINNSGSGTEFTASFEAPGPLTIVR